MGHFALHTPPSMLERQQSPVRLPPVSAGHARQVVVLLQCGVQGITPGIKYLYILDAHMCILERTQRRIGIVDEIYNYFG